MPVLVKRTAPGSPALDPRILRTRAERMLAEMGEGAAELSIILVDDSRILELNRTYRKKAKPTDVLAFPMGAPNGPGAPGSARLLGDVVISLDTALRQARTRRHSLAEEVVQLLAHGLLHLVGYDHRTDAEEKRMNAAAARLVSTSARPGPSRQRMRDRR